MERLGFVEPPYRLWIYANRSNPPHLWYTVKDGEIIGLPTNALRAYLVNFKFEKVEKKKAGEVIKLQVELMGDRPYTIETSHDTHFAKGFLAAVALMGPEHWRSPITIVPSPGDDEAVLFCRVFSGTEPIRAQYTEETDLRGLAKSAMESLHFFQQSQERVSA